MARASENLPLDDTLPHEPQRAQAQVQGVIELLDPAPKRVLELGCGAGRLLVPLAQQGHHITAFDRDPAAIAACQRSLLAVQQRAIVVEADFLQWLRDQTNDESFDAILCLGNTFMTIADLDDALDLLAQVRRLLAPNGVFVLDDLPHDLWPQLTEGDWTSGISEDGSMQLVWHPHDSIFTIRHGERVDPESWSLKDDDALYRLWMSGALRLAARLSGLSEPQHCPNDGLLILRRPDSAVGVK